MRRSTFEALRNLHLLLDVGGAVVAMLLAPRLHEALRAVLPWLPALPPFTSYAALAYATPLLWALLVVAFRLNRTFEHVWTLGALSVALVELHAAGLLGLSLLQFLLQSSANRGLAASFFACSFTLMLGLRVLLNRWARYQHRQGLTRPRFVLVGQPSRRMVDFVRVVSCGAFPPRVLGYLSAPDLADALSAPPPGVELPAHLGPLSAPALRALLHDQAVDEVLFFAPLQRPEQVADEVAVCEALGVSASFAVSLDEVARAPSHVTSICEHPFVTLEVSPKRPELLALKHGLDPVTAALLLLLLSPLLALAALAILLAMGRPVLFVQQRAGLNGRPFAMLKFRSMVRGADAEALAAVGMDEPGLPPKPERDPRVTPLGRLLRRTSLDELPQLVNVLTGSMSLVGPRPLPLPAQRQLRDWQRRRLSMKPGMTGLWQVSGRSELELEEWMALDLEYVERWGLWLDLTILLRTIPVVLSGRGAR